MIKKNTLVDYINSVGAKAEVVPVFSFRMLEVI